MQSNQNNFVLNKWRKHLIKRSDKNNKIQIKDVKFPSFYLPPLSDSAELFGNITSQKQIIDILEKRHNTDLEISNASRYALYGKGIGLRTFDKLIVWLNKIPMNFDNMFTDKLMARVLSSIKVGSNAGGWLAAIHSWEVNLTASDITGRHECEPLFSFITHRCNTDKKLLAGIIKEIKSGKIKTDDLAAVWQHQKMLWRDNPYIPSGIIENVFTLSELRRKKATINKEERLSIIESECYLLFDFYMEIITHYEIGCRIYFTKENDEISKDLGLITKIIEAYATDDAINTCFDSMIRQFTISFTELVGETGYRKLASFIEINEDGSSELVVDRQYNQLKDWRKGKNLPSKEKLSHFSSNLALFINYDDDSSDSYLIFMLCIIAIGVDKLLKQYIEQRADDTCCKKDIEVIIKKVLANIPNYYKTNLSNELKKKESAT